MRTPLPPKYYAIMCRYSTGVDTWSRDSLADAREYILQSMHADEQKRVLNVLEVDSFTGTVVTVMTADDVTNMIDEVEAQHESDIRASDREMLSDANYMQGIW